MRRLLDLPPFNALFSVHRQIMRFASDSAITIHNLAVFNRITPEIPHLLTTFNSIIMDEHCACILAFLR